MNTLRLPLTLLFVLIAASVAQQAWYWPQLPEKIATHFGIDGTPNDWMSRTSGTLLMCGLQVGIPLFLVSVTWLANRLPNSMMNIPHREYWLHPERRAETLDWMNRMLAWIAVLTVLLMIVMGYLTFVANVKAERLDITSSTILLVAYLATVFAIAGRSLWRFRRPSSMMPT